MTLEQTPEAVERIERKLDEILGIARTIRIGRGTVAELFVGRSTSWCERRPWAYPPETQNGKWSIAECLDYYSVPLEIREEQWRSKMRRSA